MIAILLICLAIPANLAAGPSPAIIPTLLEVNGRLQDAPYNNMQREALLRGWFRGSGCKLLTEQSVIGGHPPNLICTLKGKSDSLIVVGGHSDHVRKGMGVVDDWSGASMLPSLFQDLRIKNRNHTFMFVGFTDEEKGLVGSAFFVWHLPGNEKVRIRAMVNLECLGLAQPEVWSDHAAPNLLSGLLQVARRMRIPVREVDLERVGRDDAESFREASIPTITIHSLTQDTIHIMHSPRDNFSAINVSDYDESYQLIAAYLTYLDGVLQ
ncbi:MAG TPA: M28 family peptidase [Terriglobia bacterium]|nr:M28 family peptidase [Terriglobia bacterium]